jgi:hypothetical protein
VTEENRQQEATGTWHVKDDQLCTNFGKVMVSSCYEVWASGLRQRLKLAFDTGKYQQYPTIDSGMAWTPANVVFAVMSHMGQTEKSNHEHHLLGNGADAAADGDVAREPFTRTKLGRRIGPLMSVIEGKPDDMCSL